MRKDISSLVERAVQSRGTDLDNHNMKEITVDRIIATFVSFLPEEVDLNSKYELNGMPFQLTVDTLNRNEKENSENLLHMARFANDEGFNRCIREIKDKIKKEYLQA